MGLGHSGGCHGGAEPVFQSLCCVARVEQGFIRLEGAAGRARLLVSIVTRHVIIPSNTQGPCQKFLSYSQLARSSFCLSTPALASAIKKIINQGSKPGPL